jgi:hypothetical protein
MTAMILVILGMLAVAQAATPPSVAFDVSRLVIGAPVRVTELDLATLKGDLRRVSWSPDGRDMYVQTAEQDKAQERLHHYLVTVASGAVMRVDAEPTWASEYWVTKSDRTAPGMPALAIEVEQKVETMKIGTGSAGAADRTTSGLGGDNINSDANLERAAQRRKVNVVRLFLLGETVSEFLDERPLPGLMFGWGPAGSGAIAFTDREGRLTLFDAQKHKQRVPGLKEASMPAWSADGSRLAYLRHAGKKKYVVEWVSVSAAR